MGGSRLAYMAVKETDPGCAGCISSTAVELVSGDPCVIKLHMVLGSFPASNDQVTSASFSYDDGDGNSTVVNLAPPVGPPLSGWKANSNFLIQFNAQGWLTSGDFPDTTARIDVGTYRGNSTYEEWAGTT